MPAIVGRPLRARLHELEAVAEWIGHVDAIESVERLIVSSAEPARASRARKHRVVPCGIWLPLRPRPIPPGSLGVQPSDEHLPVLADPRHQLW